MKAEDAILVDGRRVGYVITFDEDDDSATVEYQPSGEEEEGVIGNRIEVL